ncbi:MAG: hypothetical protein GF405_03260 [Candidatus Eisenbacteria bacterium]|nr:hypothetical protein [Candidatus Eisenbacteria bacterium]
MYVRALVVWCVLAVVAVLNGVVRNALLTPGMGEERAHVLSTVTLSVLIIGVALAFARWIGLRSRLDAAMVGLLWVLLTLSFEFLAGHFVFGHAWEKLLADYNVLRGRVWIVIPVVTYLAPGIARRIVVTG